MVERCTLRCLAGEKEVEERLLLYLEVSSKNSAFYPFPCAVSKDSSVLSAYAHIEVRGLVSFPSTLEE